MTTEAQITANRANAKKSTGPRTAEGKAVVAQNAIKHGLLSRRAVIKDEDPAEFEGYRAAMIESLRPRDAAEESVVQRIVNLSWRLKRAERMQDETLNFLLEADARECQTRHLRASGDPSGSEELTFGRVIAREFSSGRTLEKLMTYERWIENSLYRSFNELHRLRREQEALKQSQSAEVSCSTPALGGDPSRGRLGYMVDHPICETKPIGEVSSLKCEVPSETESGSACETKPIDGGEAAVGAGPGARPGQPQGVAPANAKQSQSAERATGARTLPRCVRRVAWHYHGVPRS